MLGVSLRLQLTSSGAMEHMCLYSEVRIYPSPSLDEHQHAGHAEECDRAPMIKRDADTLCCRGPSGQQALPMALLHQEGESCSSASEEEEVEGSVT